MQELSSTLSHLELTTVLCSGCDCPHFTDEKLVLGLSTRQHRAKIKLNNYRSSLHSPLPYRILSAKQAAENMRNLEAEA